ncbi:hypothetical protein [Hankyongella ginsenosidimutans]|uniref:hypothetical protein n=1 Tax=Hankyongella ginsenosidimutans TaxID=1763828 RepID=UPI001CA34B17|nr:hypothetical protein [Hankyongella ginsenosidimutans]
MRGWRCFCTGRAHLCAVDGAYRLGWFGALWRTGYVTMIMAPIAITLFIVAIFLLGALG